ncbi:hypothetical protein [Pseudoduganella sp.]|uniref:hypothetical protein n=1 Tax=Pseudoduganella sp. TaxID=1880898 RepID=UPI0035ADFA30
MNNAKSGDSPFDSSSDDILVLEVAPAELQHASTASERAASALYAGRKVLLQPRIKAAPAKRPQLLPAWTLHAMMALTCGLVLSLISAILAPDSFLSAFLSGLGGTIAGVIVTRWDEKHHPGSYDL